MLKVDDLFGIVQRRSQQGKVRELISSLVNGAFFHFLGPNGDLRVLRVFENFEGFEGIEGLLGFECLKNCVL